MPSSRVSREAKSRKKTQNPITHHGMRLKHARLRKGYTLRQLAERVDCSESMISKLENSRLSPSLAMLHRLADALDTTAAELLIQNNDTEDDDGVVFFPAGSTNGKKPQEDGEEVKIWWERILPLDKSGLLQVGFQNLLPGAEQTRFLSHEGEEFILVLEGTFELIFEHKTYTLKAGDGLFFSSTMGHRYRNAADTVTRTFWVGTPPVM